MKKRGFHTLVLAIPETFSFQWLFHDLTVFGYSTTICLGTNKYCLKRFTSTFPFIISGQQSALFQISSKSTLLRLELYLLKSPTWKC